MSGVQLNIFGTDDSSASRSIINVASVPQRSPFRYPGGKTWFVPVFRKWLKSVGSHATTLVEPFAGGGIIGLTAAFENLADRVVLSELDEEVAAVWEALVNGEGELLAQKIFNFHLSVENAKLELDKEPASTVQRAFITILKNRIYHGGIIARGSGLIKNGENGKGIASRWYPKTLRDRILAISSIRSRIEFYRKDAFEIIPHYGKDPSNCFFIDPPYTVAGKRLYTFYEIDHEKLFQEISQIKGHFLVTYDDTAEIRELAVGHGLPYRSIPMKTTHHLKKNELVLSDSFDWFDGERLHGH